MTAIPPPAQTVLDLFSAHLADVRFGDLDAQSLARAASDVQSAHDVLVSAQLALETARRSLVERQEVLLQQVQRALAYARVYAEADEALSAQLEAVTLPRAPKRARSEALGTSDVLVLTSEAQPAPRPRGRPRKLAPAPAPAPAPTSELLAHAGE